MGEAIQQAGKENAGIFRGRQDEWPQCQVDSSTFRWRRIHQQFHENLECCFIPLQGEQ